MGGFKQRIFWITKVTGRYCKRKWKKKSLLYSVNSYLFDNTMCLWSRRLLTVMPQRWRSSRRSSDSSRLLSATSLSATIRRWDGDVAWHPSPPPTTRTRTCRSSPCQPTYCRYRLGHLSPPSFCCPDTKGMSAWRSYSTCVYQTCNEIFIS